MSLRHELFGMATVDLLPLTLAVGAEGTASRWTFIRDQSAPFEAVHDVFFRSRYISRLVGILYPQYEVATVPARKEEIVQNRPHSAQMQPTCRTRRKPHPDFL
jgi:hypothetical protein